MGGLANITPPGRSRLPVRMLTTSTSQLVSVPNSTVEVPMQYTAALGAPAISRAPASGCFVGGDTDVLGDGIRREVRGGRADPLHARDVVGQRAEVDEILVKEARGRSRTAAPRRYPAAARCAGRPARRSWCATGRSPPESAAALA